MSKTCVVCGVVGVPSTEKGVHVCAYRALCGISICGKERGRITRAIGHEPYTGYNGKRVRSQEFCISLLGPAAEIPGVSETLQSLRLRSIANGIPEFDESRPNMRLTESMLIDTPPTNALMMDTPPVIPVIPLAPLLDIGNARANALACSQSLEAERINVKRAVARKKRARSALDRACSDHGGAEDIADQKKLRVESARTSLLIAEREAEKADKILNELEEKVSACCDEEDAAANEETEARRKFEAAVVAENAALADFGRAQLFQQDPDEACARALLDIADN